MVQTLALGKFASLSLSFLGGKMGTKQNPFQSVAVRIQSANTPKNS